MTTLRRLLFEYGMVLVLLLLCALFSVMTLSEQHPAGDAAARQLARDVVARFGKDARVFVAVRDQAEDLAFLRALESQFVASGVHVLEVVKGEPKDARAALQRQAAAGGRLDAI